MLRPSQVKANFMPFYFPVVSSLISPQELNPNVKPKKHWPTKLSMKSTISELQEKRPMQIPKSNALKKSRDTLQCRNALVTRIALFLKYLSKKTSRTCSRTIRPFPLPLKANFLN